jgi:hypothetical protein
VCAKPVVAIHCLGCQSSKQRQLYPCQAPQCFFWTALK